MNNQEWLGYLLGEYDPIDVIHIRHAKTAPNYVYIGRAGKGKPGSPLANPYRMSHGGERMAVIEKYRVWLHDRLRDGTPQMAELRRLNQLRKRYGRLYLVCFCAPKPCHGDVIKEALDA